MDVKDIAGIAFGYEFTQPEFAILGKNLRNFAHVAIAAEIRANSPNTQFGKKVNRHASMRHAHTVRHNIVAPDDIVGRLRQERDQMRALLSSEAPIDKDAQSNVVLGMFTTQVAFDALAEPIRVLSPHLHEPDQLIAMRSKYLAASPLA